MIGNWNILMGAPQPHDVAAGVQQGFQMAQERRRQQQEDALRMEQREAQAKRQQEEDALAQLERHRENIIKGARIVRQINPQDEAGWQRARAMAAQLGIPMDEVPAAFDPEYVQNLVKVADTFAPESGGAGFTLGEGQVRYDANGRALARGPAPRPRYYPVPQGGRLELDPAYQGAAGPSSEPPALGAIDVDEETGETYRFKGGDPTDPGSWEAVGGPGHGGPGTFP